MGGPSHPSLNPVALSPGECPQGHPEMSGDVVLSQLSKGATGFKWLETGMLLNISQCTGQPSAPRVTRPWMSPVRLSGYPDSGPPRTPLRHRMVMGGRSWQTEAGGCQPAPGRGWLLTGAPRLPHPGELLPGIRPSAVGAAGPPAPGAHPPLQPAALGGPGEPGEPGCAPGQ